MMLQKEHLKIAQQFFQLVGKAAGECGESLSVFIFVELQYIGFSRTRKSKLVQNSAEKLTCVVLVIAIG